MQLEHDIKFVVKKERDVFEGKAMNENMKVTLTIGQLKRLIRESRAPLQDEGDDSGEEEFTRALVEISNIVWKTGRQTCPKYLPRNLTAKICLYGYDSDVHEADVKEWLEQKYQEYPVASFDFKVIKKTAIGKS